MTATINQALATASTQLTASDTALLDVEILLAYALNVSRTHLLTWPEQEIPTAIEEQFDSLVQQRVKGEPIAYLVGTQEFWSLSFKVTPDTLIPRPETELLVEKALEIIPVNASWEIADLGTGSGAIALAVAHERPQCRVTAIDRSPAALAVAKENAERLNITNVDFDEGDWFAPLAEKKYQVILSNPPYVADQDPHLKQGDVRFEPTGALEAGPQGMNDLEILITQAGPHLLQEGCLILEHGFDQAEAVGRLFRQNAFSNIRSITDYAGQARLTMGQYTAQLSK